MRSGWPDDAGELADAQRRLAADADAAPAWRAGDAPLAGGCFLAYALGQAGPGGPGDRAWAAAVAWRRVRVVEVDETADAPPRGPDRVLAGTGPGGPRQASDVQEQAVVCGEVPAAYQPGLLALREGPLLEAAVRALATGPEVLLVDATGRDHPRRAGLAMHLGAVLGIPTVGVTHRPLVAGGAEPDRRRGCTAPVEASGEVVGRWVCTRTGVRPVVAHAAWRTDPATAAAVVLACSSQGARIPAPLGEARRVAREARALAEGRWSARRR